MRVTSHNGDDCGIGGEEKMVFCSHEAVSVCNGD